MPTPFAPILIDGLALGSLYALLALGFVVVYQATETFNFAFAAQVALGAFLAVGATVALPGAAALAIAASATIGFAIQPLLVRPLAGRSSLDATLGLIALSMALGAGIEMVFGPGPWTLPKPIAGELVLGRGLAIPAPRLGEAAASWGCIIVVGLILRFTSLGLLIRSGPEGQEAAREAGVDVAAMQRLAFAIGGLCAGVGGLILAERQGASTDLYGVALLAIPAAAIGGLRSLPGAIVGGMGVGLIVPFAAAYALPKSGEFAVYLALLALLVLRPRGLLSPREWGLR